MEDSDTRLIARLADQVSELGAANIILMAQRDALTHEIVRVQGESNQRAALIESLAEKLATASAHLTRVAERRECGRCELFPIDTGEPVG